VANFRGSLLKKPAFIVLLAALLLIVPIQEISSRNAGSTGSIAQALQQASSETSTISRYSYFLTQQRVEVTYLRLLLFPAGQNLDYDYPVFSSARKWPLVGSMMLHALLAALAVVILLRSNRDRDAGECNSPAMRLGGIGIAWFYLTLSVESSVIPIRDVIFEHRLYLPSVGFFMAATAGAGWLAARRGWMRTGGWCLLALLAVVLTVATINRNRVWNSELGMWMDVTEKSPDKARARANAGLYFAKRMVNERAVLNFVRAIELDPLNDKNRIYLNQLVTGLEGYDTRAADGMRYQSGLDVVDPGKIVPWRALSFNNMGLAYEFLNRPAQAMQNYISAVSLDPGLDLAWYNMALLAGRQNDAARCRQAAERLEPLNRVLWETLRQQKICGP
jgi:tetratricopeptide (TPR) repeat protein